MTDDSNEPVTRITTGASLAHLVISDAAPTAEQGNAAILSAGVYCEEERWRWWIRSSHGLKTGGGYATREEALAAMRTVIDDHQGSAVTADASLLRMLGVECAEWSRHLERAGSADCQRLREIGQIILSIADRLQSRLD